MTPEEKIACARIVATVILADAHITDAEHEFLQRVFQELGLSSEERKQATTHLDVGASVQEVASVLRDDAARVEAVRYAARAMTVDGEAVKTERRVVDDIAKALGLGPEVAAEAIRLAMTEPR